MTGWRKLLAGGLLAALAALAASAASDSLQAEERAAADVFAKWRTGQRIFNDVNLRNYRDLGDGFLGEFRHRLPAAIRSQLHFLSLPPGERSMSPSELNRLRSGLAPLVKELDDPRGFLRFLRGRDFAGAKINASEKAARFTDVSAKYRGFLEALLNDPDEDRERTALFAAANRYFEYCFFPRRHGDCIKLAKRPEDRPLLRLLYSNMWYHLSGVGWQHWHADALAELEKRARAGDEIVYIAGGTDVYKLLIRGMTRLRVIDPIFPSQTKYYAEGWRFLVEPSGRGRDRIRFTREADGVDLVLERAEHRVTGRFASGSLSDNSKLDLPRSHTVWNVYNAGGKRVGHVVFERRFVGQKDFEQTRNRAYLISFNELNYVAATDDTGWGLQPSKFPRSLRMVVKQLRKRVDRQVMLNMEAMRNTDFYFIKLGTSIN